MLCGRVLRRQQQRRADAFWSQHCEANAVEAARAIRPWVIIPKYIIPKASMASGSGGLDRRPQSETADTVVLRRERLKRLDIICQHFPIYFVTACAAKRRKLLAGKPIRSAFKTFAASAPNYGTWIGAHYPCLTISISSWPEAEFVGLGEISERHIVFCTPS